MEGLIVDVIVSLFALGAGIFGIGFARQYYKKSKKDDPSVKKARLQEQGKKNVDEYEIKESLHCGECDVLTDPAKDLFVSGVWFHEACYKKQQGN